MEIPAVVPTEKDIAEYGILIRTESIEPDTLTEDFSFWDGLGKLHFSQGSVGLVRSYPRSRHICPSLERHERTSETLIPVNGDITVVCALSTKEEDSAQVDTNTLRAFTVKKGEALILHPGVWHYAPMVQDTVTDTFVIFQQDTLNDDLLKETYEDALNLEVKF